MGKINNSSFCNGNTINFGQLSNFEIGEIIVQALYDYYFEINESSKGKKNINFNELYEILLKIHEKKELNEEGVFLLNLAKTNLDKIKEFLSSNNID